MSRRGFLRALGVTSMVVGLGGLWIPPKKEVFRIGFFAYEEIGISWVNYDKLDVRKYLRPSLLEQFHEGKMVGRWQVE